MLSVTVCGQSIQERVSSWKDVASYEVAYDKFKKLTTVWIWCRLVADTGKSPMARAFVFLHNGPKHSTDFVLHFRQPYTVYNRPTLRILADSKLITIDSTDIGDSAMFFIEPPDVKKIVFAKTVEMQLETFEGKFDTATLIKLRNLYFLTIPRPR